MLTVLTTTEYEQQIQESIASIDRLHELVEVVLELEEISKSSKVLLIENGVIKTDIDWHETEPPYVIPPTPFSSQHVLALIFYKLGNHKKALEYLPVEEELRAHLLLMHNLQYGYEITDKLIASTLPQVDHNLCIIHHYGNVEKKINLPLLKSHYQYAIAHADNDEMKIYTAKHYINLLIDNEEYDEGEKVARTIKDSAISEEAINAINLQLANVLMRRVAIPYDNTLLKEIQHLQHESIAFYEHRKLKINAGLVLIDASEIANFQDDFITSKELISRAIQSFQEENIPEFLGEAVLRKATLLYTWSKSGSPQYYKPAINAFHDALKVFKKDTQPKKFADIHHNLALIYSEIPVSSKEQPIWAALSASSFKEALSFYKKEYHPYEYAMVSHNYATALMNFPAAKLHNNLTKALTLFEDVLEIRTAAHFSFERASTLLNQLELYWLMHNENNKAETVRYDQMRLKIEEIRTLVTDKKLLERAAFHARELEKLKTMIDHA